MKPDSGNQLDKRRRRADAGQDKNVMPSMVVRQQRQQQLQISSHPAAGFEASGGSSAAVYELSQQVSHQQQHLFDQDGLVLPKRIAHHNPVVLASQQPIIRDLNRELKFNQIRGKNVLDQKSELKKALERLEESKRRKEAEQERLNRRSSLELRLEERAERLAKETTSAAAAATTTTITSSKTTSPEQQQDCDRDPAKAATSCKPALSDLSIRSITR